MNFETRRQIQAGGVDVEFLENGGRVEITRGRISNGRRAGGPMPHGGSVSGVSAPVSVLPAERRFPCERDVLAAAGKSLAALQDFVEGLMMKVLF